MKKTILSLALLLCSAMMHAQWSMDPAVNTPVCTAAEKQIDPRMMEDGKGGAFIVWKDYRNGAANPDIVVQRLNALGFPMWTLNGINVCSDSADQSTPAIVSDMRGGAIIAWSDWRSGVERDLYAQRIDSNGVVKWTTNGANISNLSNREHSEKLASDGKGGMIIAFEKQIGGVWDVWSQRLDSSGTKMWGQGGIQLTAATGTHRNHRIQKDRTGGAIITWQDLRNGSNYDVYAQRVDAAGNVLWGATGKPVCSAAGDQINAKIDPDSLHNGAFVAWQDTRNSPDYDIYMQRLDSNGNALWAVDGVVVSNANGNQSALDFLTISSTNEVLIAWKDSRNGDNDIYAQKMNANGIPQWTSNGIPVCTSPLDQQNPNICSDENKGAIIVWQDSSGNGFDVRAQRLSTNGTAVWNTNGVWVCTAAGEQSSPKNISDGKGGSIFAWQDKRSGTNDIYAHHLFPSGSPNILVETNFTRQISLFPNPAPEEIHFQLPESERLKQLELFSITGQLLITTEQCAEQRLNIHSLAPGSYILRIKTEKGSYSARFQKQ